MRELLVDVAIVVGFAHLILTGAFALLWSLELVIEATMKLSRFNKVLLEYAIDRKRYKAWKEKRRLDLMDEEGEESR